LQAVIADAFDTLLPATDLTTAPVVTDSEPTIAPASGRTNSLDASDTLLLTAEPTIVPVISKFQH
jgi:hypothetical protein